jgi:magnesium-protoporphyrin IX monomethyl ester (oxidative) cyclase
MAEVALAYVPFGALERPSLAVGLLKAALARAGIGCDVRYSNFEFAERVGLELYGKLAWVREEMIGEWIFSGAAFPDFNFDVDVYLEQVLDSFYPSADERARQFGRDYLLYAREEADAFIDDQARALLDAGARIVACSSTFNQNTASLALTRRVKQLDPSVVTVIGGANCEAAMGVAMARNFEWLDYVASGEAELSFPELCRAILESDGPVPEKELPYGTISARAADRHRLAPPRAMVRDLEATPVPDFDDYFAALERYSARDCITPGLAAETARGCWWGAVHHCKFCGLNGGAMDFRSKEPERVRSEMKSLSSKYGVKRFMMADNILDHSYYRSLLPTLSGMGYEMYLEIKANVSRAQLQALKDAGAAWLVAGIEGLHDGALKLMDKGTSGWLNVQMLKWSRGIGIHVSWNMLCGLPGEQDEWYGEMAEWLPLIYHLEPPNDMRIIRFDRFSPYQARPDDYGLTLRPAWPYAHIYPLPPEELDDLVYFFEQEGRDPVHINPFRQRLNASGLPSLGGPGRDGLQQLIHEWIRLFRSDSPPVLRMTDEGDRIRIVDTRPVAPAERVTLDGLASRVYRACDRAATHQSLLAVLAKDGGPAVDPAEVDSHLGDLVARKLMVRFGDRYLALAVSGPMPPLPWMNQDGYPGGWFVYPRPPVIPDGLKRFIRARKAQREAAPATGART